MIKMAATLSVLGKERQCSMTLLFLDTEFTDLSPDAKLMSIGLVSECGRYTFYRETSNWTKWDPSDFVVEKVLPHMGPAEDRISLVELATQLTAWLEGFGARVTIATDSWAWDWTMLADVFDQTDGPSWPECLERYPVLLTVNYLNDYVRFDMEIERLFATRRYRRHHAADDAEVNRLAYLVSEGV